KIRPSQLPELFEKLPFIYSTLNEEEIQRFTLNLLIRFISSVSIEDVESSLIFLKELDSVFFEFSLDAHQIIIQKNLRDNFNCLKEILKSVPPKEVRDLNLEASFEGLLQSAPIVKSLSLQSKNLEIHTLKLLAQNYKTLSDELPAIYAYLLSSGFDESYIQSIFDLSGGINLFHLIKAALKVFEGSEHIVKENLLTKDVAQLVLLSRYLARITIPFSDRNNELIKNIIKLLPFIHTEGSVISGLINFLTGLSESKVDKIITSLAIILSDKEIDFDTLPLMKVITQFENSSDELIEALLILKDMTSYQLARFIQAADLVSTLITKHTLVAFLRGFIGCDSPGLTIDDVIATIFQSNLELTQDIRSHIVRALETSPDRNYISSLVFQARRYITFAPDNIDWALLQAAESYVEPSSQANLHNPYRIYFRHLALKDAPLISPVSSFVEECESFSGSICQGNLFDRMTHVPRSSIETMTGGHIMSYTELLAMLTDLEGRLFTRPDADLEVLLKPASEGGHGILDFIQEELLSQDAAYPRVAMLRQLITNLKHPFFKETLDATNQEMVSLPSAYLQAILHFISSQDQGVPPGRIISDSDVLLLRISSSMLYCNAGKSEGLFVAYKTFVSKESEGRYVIGTQKDVVSEEENKVKGYVHDFVIDRILQELSNPAHLMRKLSGRSASGFIAQPSHEAIYIKNMLGPILGLPHEIAFDFYTSTVSADLISKTREELLSLFYLHFSLRNLSEALAQNFNSLDVKVKNAYFSLINEKAPYEMLEKIWELDDEGNFSLRLKGAFYLLSLFGIV
ncbi:MAG: hypothetical protein EBR67_10215, partial [Proteobacteria bacterium]|nr:hypothetical protein [Pseudomonadota bacterium]